MKKTVIISILVVLLLAAAGISYIAYDINSFLKNTTITKEIVINKGQSFSKLYKEMFEGKNTPAFFYDYLRRIKQIPQNMKFGYYYADNITAEELLYNITNGIQSTVKVTIPEGYEIFNTAAALQNAGIIDDKEDFVNAAFNRQVVKSITGYEYDSMEGFLYPGTYKFPKNVTPQDIMKFMYNEFLKNLPADFEKNAKERGLTFYEALTLASIVQKETYDEEEAPLVASVYYNRLKVRMRLQADPTILYGKFLRRDFEIKIGRKDLRDSTNIYNTYQHYGLTPTPICSPSGVALRAVANPADTKYVFFVAGKDGKHLFSETYEQHRRYVNEHQK